MVVLSASHSAGATAAVVTNPIAKSVLYAAGFAHPGHTEFLAHLASDGGETPLPVMMLWCPELAVVPVTIHVPLREVPLTRGGTISFQVENTLAAVAAAWGCGLHFDAVRSGLASFVTGSSVHVDGGLHAAGGWHRRAPLAG